MNYTAALLLALILTVPALTAQDNSPHRNAEGTRSAAYERAEEKFDYITRNAQQATPDQKPTQITMEELNAWVNEGGVTLPAGVERVKFSSEPAVLTAHTRVDFDRLTGGKFSSNPLMYLFTGTHEVSVSSQASGAGGMGTVRVDRVEIDGVRVPRAALEYFVENYLKPRYGENVGLDSQFRLPARIDMAILGENSVTLTQK